MLEKSRNLNVDCIAYDLEDSVTIGKKAEARTSIRRLLDQPRAKGVNENAVRINSIESGLALDDLTAVVSFCASLITTYQEQLIGDKLQAPNLDTIVIPKANSASDIHFVTDVLRHALPIRQQMGSSGNSHAHPVRLLALIESAKALSDLPAICRASPYMSGLIFGAEDFALDLSLTRTPAMTEMSYARSAISTACRAFDLPSTIDLVCTAYKGNDAREKLEEECLGGKGMGFNGKQCIHPSQVEVTQKAFSPSQTEIDWAVRVVTATEKADRHGRGAWTLDGQMIDKPVIGKAKSIISRAQACNISIEDSVETWTHQEPE
ncbi:MAG: hypothetical protein LQ351_000600 [Letrouitia transgressa]|nr:MAG: hypothetical protein LQ351_000600 [Letrouitia transgressa]